MDQQPLFRLALEAICMTAVYDTPGGWRMTITSRRQGERFVDSERRDYSFLSSAELMDVICAEASRRLHDS